MNLLEQYGWTHFQSFQHINIDKSLCYGRVVSIRGMKYHLISDRGELEAELSGRLLHESADEEIPKVGDWVAYADYGETGYIVNLLSRINSLSRKRPGKANDKQILATNIDVAFVVQGLDRDYNPNRLERYLTQLRSCGIPATIILNKVDLIDDREKISQEVNNITNGSPVIMCSTITGEGLLSIKDSMHPGNTYILIGSSGVGKSSLLNAINGQDLQLTAQVSDVNSKGRHTTTTRDLYRMPGGQLMIDTPGMREFGLTEDSNETGFPLIEEIGQRCRFRDCRHEGEEGCAVMLAIESGELDAAAYERYLKLKKEMFRFEIGAEEKKRMNKQFGRITREAKDHRKKYKY